MNLRRRRRPSPVIPIVAMVDILVIVLLFIVATTTFRSRETQMPVKLPTAENLGKTVATQNTQTSLTVTKERKIFLGGQEVAEQDLVSALKELKMTDPDVKLKVSVDREAPHGMYVSTLDALVAAGLVKDVTTLLQRAVEGANPN
ncbi:ExbD/TolR family protein [Roseimicrobium gellanilyticum]|nr:biopolymer transporter ExbD [Roseimicrobium gellanilyticum]